MNRVILFLFTVDFFEAAYGWGMCIPLRGNSACILFISSERIGIFKLNFAALIQVSI